MKWNEKKKKKKNEKEKYWHKKKKKEKMHISTLLGHSTDWAALLQTNGTLARFFVLYFDNRGDMYYKRECKLGEFYIYDKKRKKKYI